MKDSERIRRADTIPIEYSKIEPCTPIPRQMNKFWASNRNKLQLEKMIYDDLLEQEMTHSAMFPTVIGEISNGENCPCLMIENKFKKPMPHLKSRLAEADF